MCHEQRNHAYLNSNILKKQVGDSSATNNRFVTLGEWSLSSKSAVLELTSELHVKFESRTREALQKIHNTNRKAKLRRINKIPGHRSNHTGAEC